MGAQAVSSDPSLFDGGSFRIYDNRIEVDKLGLFGRVKSTEVAYAQDLQRATLRGKMIVVTRGGLKTNLVLEFKKKDQAKQAFSILNQYIGR